MKRVIISILFAVFCSSFLYAQDNKEFVASLNDGAYVLERARMEFKYIPDHKRVDEAAKPYMTADLYESLAAAWDIPDWLDGEMGNEEFLVYFITGNDPSDRQQIESATLVCAQQGRYNGCTNLTYIEHIDTSEATSVGEMFHGCKSLVTIDSPLDFSKVVSQCDTTFTTCSALENLTFTGEII